MHTSKIQFHYEVFGLTLLSDRAIPGLEAERVPDRDAVDIRITLGTIPGDLEVLVAQSATPYHVAPGSRPGDPDHLVVRVATGGMHYQFVYDEAIEFVVDRECSAIWCRWDVSLTLEEAALYLLGPVIGFMLRLRGTTCLHASAVLVGGCALAITGAPGAGKSTLAAAFADAGYPVLTDDVLPLDLVDGRVMTRSGYARLRLYPNSFNNIPGLRDDLPPLAPGWDKCFLDLASPGYRLHREPAPLGAVYVLDWSADPGQTPPVTPIHGTEAIPMLAANTYRGDLLDPSMREGEFYFLGALLSTVPVKRFSPTDDISALPALREALLEDFRSETGLNQPPGRGQAAGNHGG